MFFARKTIFTKESFEKINICFHCTSSRYTYNSYKVNVLGLMDKRLLTTLCRPCFKIGQLAFFKIQLSGVSEARGRMISSGKGRGSSSVQGNSDPKLQNVKSFERKKRYRNQPKKVQPPFQSAFSAFDQFSRTYIICSGKGPASFSIQLRKLRPRRLAKCHRSPHAYIHVKMAKTKNGSKSCLQYLLRVKDLTFCNSRPPSNKRPSATLLREFKDGPTTMMQLKCII